MKTKTVKKLMVPLPEYATVTKDATLLDVILALENAQKAFDNDRYRHRAILVIDNKQHVIGKISQHDIIEALEPNYKTLRKERLKAMHRFGLKDISIESTLEEYSLWNKPFENLCNKAMKLKAKDIMYTPSVGEFISDRSTLDEAVHRLIVGKHHSLLVTTGSNSEIVGILRLTDVFEFICNALK